MSRLHRAGPPGIDPATLHRPEGSVDVPIQLALFRQMVRMRKFETRAYDLFMENLVKGTSHLSLGQEAIAAAFGEAMEEGDYTFATYRGSRAHARPRLIDDRGHGRAARAFVRRSVGQGRIDAPHRRATRRDGLVRHRRRPPHHRRSERHGRLSTRASDGSRVAFFGDGTTNIGAFHESLNLAAVWKLPVVVRLREQHVHGVHADRCGHRRRKPRG